MNRSAAGAAGAAGLAPAGRQNPDEFLKQHSQVDYLALQDKAPLWLDWQIEQVLSGKDLGRADQFQLAVWGWWSCWASCLSQPCAVTTCSVSLSVPCGQARMALQLEEDLRQQVKGQRWHGRSSRHEQPGDASLRERAEASCCASICMCQA